MVHHCSDILTLVIHQGNLHMVMIQWAVEEGLERA